MRASVRANIIKVIYLDLLNLDKRHESSLKVFQGALTYATVSLCWVFGQQCESQSGFQIVVFFNFLLLYNLFFIR